MDFSKRSYQKELLDRPDIPFEDIERNMRELDFINTWLGGHAISLSGLKQLVRNRKQVTICEIGCGGGDNLRVLSRYCRRRHIGLRVMGIDNNAHCIAVAREKWKDGMAEWVHSDYRNVHFGEERPDIIFSSLFCHHFTDEELVLMLTWMEKSAQVGWFINDLQRHPLAYHAIRRLTGWLSRSYLVKNDAPLSVLRGFVREEWEEYLQKAGIGPYSLRWKWAFRWLIVREVRRGERKPVENYPSNLES
ncbi:MAG TPA: methyltransferase domain-containing protein [Puia sp.]|nr:methyltransferase domain-containing protein [Puia sp.]